MKRMGKSLAAMVMLADALMQGHDVAVAGINKTTYLSRAKPKAKEQVKHETD